MDDDAYFDDVNRWLAARASDLPPARVIELCERASKAVWNAAVPLLGSMASSAVFDRALRSVGRRFSFLGRIRASQGGYDFDEFASVVDGIDPLVLRDALANLLAELLQVFDTLSGRLLTPSLLRQLMAARVEEGRAEGEPISSKRNGPVVDLGSGTPDMKAIEKIVRIGTSIDNLDAILGGGLPSGSLTLVTGPPGSGKTILAQQIGFHVASLGGRVVYVNTLSEPAAKTLRYLSQFSFFDPTQFERSFRFVDIGELLLNERIQEAGDFAMAEVKEFGPTLVVFDSFKVFDDIARSRREVRKFGYALATNLAAWESTTLLLGEYTARNVEEGPLFSIVDGLIMLRHVRAAGEEQRFVQVFKMRGAAHDRAEHPFEIGAAGIDVFAPRLSIRRTPNSGSAEPVRIRTGVSRLDELLGQGIPKGSSVLVAGVPGCGKTMLTTELIYRGAKDFGEKGIIFSFEESEDRLESLARSMSWDFAAEIAKGMIEVVFTPQPRIQVDRQLLMMRDRIAKMGAVRVVVDSMSLFLDRVSSPAVVREKIFQLATLMHEAGAVGWFVTDIPYGEGALSRRTVEETLADGVILLSWAEEHLERQRYIEIYKLRNTEHLTGRHPAAITQRGFEIFPRFNVERRDDMAPPPLLPSVRLASGVPGLDEILGGGLLERSSTLVSGSPGIGKSILAMQFIAQGGSQGDRGLFVTLEEGPDQVLDNAEAIGLPLRELAQNQLVDVLYFSRDYVRAAQFHAILTDRIKEKGVKRVVIDSATHLEGEGGLSPSDLRQLMYGLIVRFKSLGTTSMVTYEHPPLFSTEVVTGRSTSPISDNLIMMRFARSGSALDNTLTVVKTRGTNHDPETHRFVIGHGGIRVQETYPVDGKRDRRSGAREMRQGGDP